MSATELLRQARRCASDRRWEDAARVYRQILAEAPEEVDALEGLGLVALQDNRAAEGLEWLRRAHSRAPTNPRLLSNLGIAQKRNGLLQEAIATYRRAVAFEPSAVTLLNLARAEREAGQLAAAIGTFQRALELRPDAPEAWSMLSNALREAGRTPEALAAAREAVSRNPCLGDAHLNEGVALHRSGQLHDALVSYWVASTSAASRTAALANLRAALGDARWQALSPLPPELLLVRRLLDAPDDVAAMLKLGTLEEQKKRPATAIACFERASELAPKAATYYVLGVSWWQLGRRERAEAAMARAFDCADADVHAYRRFGSWLCEQPKFSLADPHWQAIFARCPDDVASLVNLGVALQRQGLPSEAVKLQERALALQPECVEALVNRGSALADQGYFSDAVAAYRRVLALDSSRSSVSSNLLFSLHFDPEASPEAILAEHVAFGERFCHLLEPGRFGARNRDPERRLRVGYVSPDFRWHPVAYFLEPVLAEHAAHEVQVYCYSDVARPDAVTARMAGLVSQLVACAGWSDTQLAERIRADQIDILVDLAGHTSNNRLLVFARKPSPIQVSWIGYFDTTGLPAIDYRIADAHSVPAGAEHFFVERVVRLPRSSNCFRVTPSPEPAEPPCVRRGHITFGCFNNPAKVTREVVATFARILRALPDSRLCLKYGAFDDPRLSARYRQWLRDEGIQAERVDIWGHSSLPHFLTCFAHIDIALDPFPYSGETTAVHTLWMGVPLVALEGVTLVQRLASRVLHVVGFPEWVASSSDEYVRIALSLASDPLALARCRASLRERVQASPLLDHRGVTRELEAAYRKMWRDWCASSEPAPIPPA
jgi:protein O-GlcNAc transferase